MNWQLLIPLLITTLVAIVGWLAAHRFSVSRDRQNKRRDIRVTVLLEAYRALEFQAQRIYDKESAPGFERALADIQVVGTPEQIDLAIKAIKQMGATQTVSLTELLMSLRKDIREELRLGAAVPGFMHLRFHERKIEV